MPQLVKKIQGEILSDTIGESTLVKTIGGIIQQDDYVKLNGFIGLMQDLSNTEFTQRMAKPIVFGLLNKYNLKEMNLEIDY